MRIGVIVAVKDEADSIGQLIAALLGQSLKPEAIVITDGGSTDATATIIQSFVDRGAPVQLIRTTGAVPGRGRNLAAAACSCEWLAFTDAGCEPCREWLASLAEQVIRDPSVDVVYGSYEPVTDTFFTECASLAYVPPPSEIGGEWRRSRFLASMLSRRRVWEAVGGFAEDLRSAEDLLFMNAVEAGPFRIAYAPRAVVRWDLQPNIWRTFRRFATYSRHNIRAGLWQLWQRPIVGRYVLLALLAVPALLLDLRWLTLPLALWLLMLAARAVVAIGRNRRASPASSGRNLLRLMALVPLIAVIDCGTLVGSIQWLVADRLRLRLPSPP